MPSDDGVALHNANIGNGMTLTNRPSCGSPSQNDLPLRQAIRRGLMADGK